MKIITGIYKNRVLPIAKNATYRPSTTKVREAIFNLITNGNLGNNLDDSNVIDLFAGTGAFAFEALSRGAKNATLVDINKNYLNYAKKFAEKISAASKTSFLCLDSFKLPINKQELFDFVFIDPPYNSSKQIEKLLHSLINLHYLKENSIIVIELSKKEQIHIGDNYLKIKENIYGDTKIFVLKYCSK